jgi:hypothetical protein
MKTTKRVNRHRQNRKTSIFGPHYTNCLTKGRKLSFQEAAKRLSPYNILQLQGYFGLQTVSQLPER